MATQAIETDNGAGAGERAGVHPIHNLAPAPAEMRDGPCGMAWAGCAVSCPRFAQCGSMDRQASAAVVSWGSGCRCLIGHELLAAPASRMTTQMLAVSLRSREQ